jgi:hypothetical protein
MRSTSAADMARGRRMGRQHVERILPFCHAARGHRLAQPGLAAIVVPARVENKAGVALGRIGPARQHASQLGHVLLGIAAVHAEGMQLHQLARIVFVQPARLRDPVIQIEQHGRMAGGGAQHLAEGAEYVRPDGIAFVAGHQGTVLALARKHVEVVVPEVDHHFFQLARTFDGAQQACFGRLGRHPRHDLAAPALPPLLACPFAACPVLPRPIVARPFLACHPARLLEARQCFAGAHIHRFQLVQPLS